MGQIRGLIGPNGAGKTTIFNLLTGIYTPTEGEILLDGKENQRSSAHRIASMASAGPFRTSSFGGHMTVLEHVKLAHYSKSGTDCSGPSSEHPGATGKRPGSKRRRFAYWTGWASRHLAEQVVLNLPYGAQRRVEMARALATEPRILLLDEPTAG